MRTKVHMFGSRPVVPDARDDKTYLRLSSIPSSKDLSLSPKAKDLQVMSKWNLNTAAGLQNHPGTL